MPKLLSHVRTRLLDQHNSNAHNGKKLVHCPACTPDIRATQRADGWIVLSVPKSITTVPGIMVERREEEDDDA
jgi:hypothetical protein